MVTAFQKDRCQWYSQCNKISQCQKLINKVWADLNVYHTQELETSGDVVYMD